MPRAPVYARTSGMEVFKNEEEDCDKVVLKPQRVLRERI
jgi:hypothetical protein